MIILLDKNLTARGILSSENPQACPYWNDKHKEQLEDGLLTYEFTAPTDHSTAIDIVAEAYVIVRDLDKNLILFRIKEVIEAQEDGKYVKQALCENAAIDELLGSIIRPVTLSSYSAQQALTSVLSGTEWGVGAVDWLGTKDIKIDDYPTAYEALQTVRGLFGGELVFRVEFSGTTVTNRYVDLVTQRGQNNGVRFEYGRNIKGVTRTEESRGLVTALIGVGKADTDGNRLTFRNEVWTSQNGDTYAKPSGQDYIEDTEALQRWGRNGRHVFGVYESDTDSALDLLNETAEELGKRNKPRITYTLSALLLERITGYEAHRVRLGDTVVVKDTTFSPPLIIQARVIDLTRSYTDPSADEVTLGEFAPVFVDVSKLISDMQKQLTKMSGTAEVAQVAVRTLSTNGSKFLSQPTIKSFGGDENGVAVSIGSGAKVVVGAGEAADTVAAQESGNFSEEDLVLAADQRIRVMPNVQGGYGSAKTATFNTDGSLNLSGTIVASGIVFNSFNSAPPSLVSTIWYGNGYAGWGWYYRHTNGWLKTIDDENA